MVPVGRQNGRLLRECEWGEIVEPTVETGAKDGAADSQMSLAQFSSQHNTHQWAPCQHRSTYLSNWCDDIESAFCHPIYETVPTFVRKYLFHQFLKENSFEKILQNLKM